MKNVGKLLEREITRRRVKRKDLCEFIGMYPQNLTKYLAKGSIEAELLEKFCQYLNLDPASFFDFRPYGQESTLSLGEIHQDVVVGAANVSINAMKEEMMHRLLEEKDKRIALLEENIELLKKQIARHESDCLNSADS